MNYNLDPKLKCAKCQQNLPSPLSDDFLQEMINKAIPQIIKYFIPPRYATQPNRSVTKFPRPQPSIFLPARLTQSDRLLSSSAI